MEQKTISTEPIMGIGPGAEFRVRSKVLDDVQHIVVLGFELDQDQAVVEPDLTYVRVADKRRGGRDQTYSFQALLNGMGGSDRHIEVEWLNPPLKDGKI